MPPYISQSMDGQPPRPVSNLTPNQLKLQLRQTDSNLILLTHLVHPELFLENKSNKQINLFFIEFSIFLACNPPSKRLQKRQTFDLFFHSSNSVSLLFFLLLLLPLFAQRERVTIARRKINDFVLTIGIEWPASHRKSSAFVSGRASAATLKNAHRAQSAGNISILV